MLANALSKATTNRVQHPVQFLEVRRVLEIYTVAEVLDIRNGESQMTPIIQFPKCNY